MIVTFISQCEKKALNRSRRVLDAFAERIGERTWQTVITEEGLLAVKKLLRKTVTKNTAVACHWIRSRSRSDLLWIVGSREQFNLYGIVPVNITQKELPTEEQPIMKKTEQFYANTHLQPLTEHLFAVGYVAEQFIRQLIGEDTKLADAAFIAGCFHDIGKIDPHFQNWAANPKKRDFIAEDGQHIDDAKFSFDKHPRHNELSVLIYHILDNNAPKTLNGTLKEAVKHVIYWHHAKPFRSKADYKKLNSVYEKLNDNFKGTDWTGFLNSAVAQLLTICHLDTTYRHGKENETVSLLNKCFSQQFDQDDLASLRGIDLPDYKTYSNNIERVENYVKDTKSNADNNILRSAVISADRLISKLDTETLQKHIHEQTLDTLVSKALLTGSSLSEYIHQCLTEFETKYPDSERNQEQAKAAQNLVNTENITILAGAAGCGKTKIALEWAYLKNAQQIIWVCPRVQVCQGIFNDLISEEYLSGAKIEINTGEFKCTDSWENETSEKSYFSGDIVITTIDQILSNITTHTKVTELINFLNVHVVFDEFHEYINMPAFNLLFAELVACKRLRGKDANTLLVSATPNYYFAENILGIKKYDIVKMPSFNQSLYQIEIKVNDESADNKQNLFYQAQKDNTFVITNTVITAQKSFIRNQANENAILFHSKYTKADKVKWFNEVYESFKNKGTEKFSVLRSGPIVQASLNISCDYMVTELTNAENSLQRLGRLDRFGKNTQANRYTVVVSEGIQKGRGNDHAARFLSRMYMGAAARVWHTFLQEHIDGKPLKLPDIYDLYEKFHDTDGAKQASNDDLLASFKKGVCLIDNRVIDPVTFPAKKSKIKTKTKISKNSLRGDNRFVQMAVINATDPDQPAFENFYAYEVVEGQDVNNLTLSTEEIEGHGDSTKNLLGHMMKKHHNIIEGVKKAYNDSVLRNQARDPDFPIYVSYIPTDLAKVEGEAARHSSAIYYVVCDKQPVGAMSINHLTNNKE